MSLSDATLERDFLATPQHRTVLPGGLEFHHIEAGLGQPLILLHGVLGDWRSWEGLWPAFTRRYRTLAYSRRYNWPNRNTHPCPDHSALVEASDLEQLLARWNLGPVILVGSSYGAYTALALALRRPDLVRAMALSEPPMLSWASLDAQGQAVRDAFDQQIRLPAQQDFQQGRDREAVERLTGGIMGASARSQLPDWVMERRQQNMLSIRMLTLSSDEFPFLPEQAIRQLQVPTLLMAGANTPAIHAAVFQRLCAGMPQARQVRVPGAGHAVDRDKPEQFCELIFDFLDETLGRPGA